MFIQVIQGKSSRPDEIRAKTDQWQERRGPQVPGWLGGTYGFTPDGTFVAVVRFESRDVAQANSEHPEQGEWWSEMKALFDGEVSFRDYDEVTTLLDGGSDEAGFVQVMHGQVGQPQAMRELMGGSADALRAARPDIIGATIGISPDGSYTQTTAFTDEESARRGEQQEMPADTQARFEEAQIEVTEYLDLPQPWFGTSG